MFTQQMYAYQTNPPRHRFLGGCQIEKTPHPPTSVS